MKNLNEIFNKKRYTTEFCSSRGILFPALILFVPILLAPILFLIGDYKTIGIAYVAALGYAIIPCGIVANPLHRWILKKLSLPCNF